MDNLALRLQWLLIYVVTILRGRYKPTVVNDTIYAIAANCFIETAGFVAPLERNGTGVGLLHFTGKDNYDRVNSTLHANFIRSDILESAEVDVLVHLWWLLHNNQLPTTAVLLAEKLQPKPNAKIRRLELLAKLADNQLSYSGGLDFNTVFIKIKEASWRYRY